METEPALAAAKIANASASRRRSGSRAGVDQARESVCALSARASAVCTRWLFVATDVASPLPLLVSLGTALTASPRAVAYGLCVLVCVPPPVWTALMAMVVSSPVASGLRDRLFSCVGCASFLAAKPALAALQMWHDSHHHARVKRNELLSPYNFAAYYLSELVPSGQVVVYIDSDVVVQADLINLFDANLNNHAVGAVEDCTQNSLSAYVDFPLRANILRILDNATVTALHGELCVANRGILVINVPRWRASRITRTIERLLSRFVMSDGRAWHDGVSQPPLQLALAGRYHRLRLEWNVRGLGRTEMRKSEWNSMQQVAAQMSFGNVPTIAAAAAQTVAAAAFKENPGGRSGHAVPYASPHAYRASLLHFNGQLKPWCSRIVPVGGALCAVNVSHYSPCHTLWWAEAARLLGAPDRHLVGVRSECAAIRERLPNSSTARHLLAPLAWPMELQRSRRYVIPAMENEIEEQRVRRAQFFLTFKERLARRGLRGHLVVDPKTIFRIIERVET